jgi:hypothetical protein
MGNRRTNFRPALQLSPLRNSTKAETIDALVSQQLDHFAIDPEALMDRR